jgi:cytochrome c
MYHCTGADRCALALACLLPALVQAQSVSKGQELVESRCFACHSLDFNRVGPALRGVVGRKPGTAAGYAYSEAFAAARPTWDAESIKTWLTNPELLLPGQKMNYRLDQAQDREDVVSYLTSLSTAPGN